MADRDLTDGRGRPGRLHRWEGGHDLDAEREMFTSEVGKAETSLGRGQQGWAAAGPEGVYLIWLAARPGQLLCLRPGQKSPAILASRASDPVVAGSPDGRGPVVVVWEELRGGAVELRAQVLSPL